MSIHVCTIVTPTNYTSHAHLSVYGVQFPLQESLQCFLLSLCDELQRYLLKGDLTVGIVTSCRDIPATPHTQHSIKLYSTLCTVHAYIVQLWTCHWWSHQFTSYSKQDPWYILNYRYCNTVQCKEKFAPWSHMSRYVCEAHFVATCLRLWPIQSTLPI